MRGKLYFTTREVAGLIGINTRKALHWMKQSGVAVKRPGAFRQWMMPVDKVREKWPEMWDRYCIEQGMWDALEGCGHEDPSDVGGVEWCGLCGAVRVVGALEWRLPTRRPAT